MLGLIRAIALAGLLALGSAHTALAQAPDTGMDKQSDGRFTGIAVVTDNVDWYEMFQRPEPPQFDGKGHYGPGDRGSLAIIFSNPEPRNGVVRVLCDIVARDPAETRRVASEAVCYEGPYLGPNILHPALLDLRFEMGADEPAGQAGFSVTLNDAYSGRAVTLDVSFTQGPGR